MVTQNTCPHDTKVRMAGLKDMYECTNCHKFIPVIKSKETDHAAPNIWKTVEKMTRIVAKQVHILRYDGITQKDGVSYYRFAHEAGYI